MVETLRYAVRRLIASLTFLLAAYAPAFAQEAPADLSKLPAPELSAAEEAAVDKLGLPPLLQWTGDFDGMKQRRVVRILVANSKTLYYLDRGRELGIDHDYAVAFEKALNAKYKTKSLKIRVALIPVPRDKLLSGLVDGTGDIAAGALTITPQRWEIVDFADPLASGVREVLVTGPSAPPLKSLNDLAGLEIQVRKSSSYYTHLKAFSDDMVSRGLQPILLDAAQEDLEDEDILEMVNTGLLPFAVVDRYKASLWAKVFKDITVREDLVVNQGGDIAWAIRKNSPLLKAEVDAFMKTHKVGTKFGNILVSQYLKNTKLLKNAYAPEQLKKFEHLVAIFKKHSEAYSFEYLMMMAQGFQESQLNQSARSDRGAVGVMQLLPSTAADPSIGIKGIGKDADKNIEAGVKYMALLRDRYLNDPAISDKDKVLMTFAAYNAGPGNLRKFRRLAEKMNLNPNVWFDNVEVAAAKIVGIETVQYVSNIYKYYIAYDLVEKRKARIASGDTN
jgi:membrane-bound lytic murein transglycosylase MltF